MEVPRSTGQARLRKDGVTLGVKKSAPLTSNNEDTPPTLSKQTVNSNVGQRELRSSAGQLAIVGYLSSAPASVTKEVGTETTPEDGTLQGTDTAEDGNIMIQNSPEVGDMDTKYQRDDERRIRVDLKNVGLNSSGYSSQAIQCGRVA
ncbi:hypothetical protein NDU88_001489 [Pleurodeles waltl]|uniref:Uncharacterized protein n=1 Tax=Pleurodeles waltl TaxID=8319 RepID=A0AAV7MNK4_PLEWA|nr:hypothetical protein NDU88_001489 [Pleurodeles waltl]